VQACVSAAARSPARTHPRFVDGHPRVVGAESGYPTDGFDPERSVFAGGRHMFDVIASAP
jgi:hypothetical protein